MIKIRHIGFIFAGLLNAGATPAAPIIITSAQIDAYFGTATLLSPGGGTLFTMQYLFLSNPISADLAADITMDPNANAFPIFQNNAIAAATLDPSVFVEQINNATCQPAGLLCDPAHPLPILPASSNLTVALHNLPIPAGTSSVAVSDTGNVLRGSLPDFAVVGLALDGQTSILASINISLFEHDFTALAQPISTAPEPSSGLPAAFVCTVAFVRYKFRRRFQGGRT